MRYSRKSLIRGPKGGWITEMVRYRYVKLEDCNVLLFHVPRSRTEELLRPGKKCSSQPDLATHHLLCNGSYDPLIEIA